MRVLVVEDDSALGLFLEKGLKLEGHEVTWVGDGEAALAHAAEHHPDLIVLDLSLQWGCPVLTTEGFSPETMALVVPRVFVERFGILPLRVAGSRILYLGFADQLDASAAFVTEQISGLKVESGVVERSQFEAAREQLLTCEGVEQKVETIRDPDTMAARITAILEQKQPLASRLIRLHQYYWLRLWLERGAFGRVGNLPSSGEDVMDYLFTVGAPT